MKRLILFFVFVSVGIVLFAQNAPYVYNVSGSQRTDGSKIVDIYYNLFDPDGDTLSVTLKISDNDGSSFDITPADSLLFGAIGDSVLTGDDKHIIWQAGEEDSTFEGTAYRFKVIADDNTGAVFYEDFESGEFPPSGWNEYILGSSGTGWRETTYWFHSPTHSAYHNDDNVSSISEDWLVTPVISTSIGDTLYFWEKNKYVSGYYYYHGVWLSTGSPNPADGDFIELQEYSSTASSWKLRKIDLSDYALQDIYIGFKYMGDYDTEWYIDDVGIIP